MTIINHPLWELLKKHIRIEFYDRDGSTINPRWRLEIDKPPLETFTIITSCVKCGRDIYPVRARNGKSSKAYLATTCPLSISIPCSRSQEAHQSYIDIKDAVNN